MANQFYTVEQFVRDVEAIAKKVEASGKKFSKIWAPPRGGLPLAVCLSHRLNLEFWNPSLQGGVTPLSIICGGIQYREIIREKLVNDTLIVDDIADTGQTLQHFKSYGFYIATLFKHPQSTVTPNIWLHEKSADWIVFWWESIGPLTCGSLPAV